MRINSRSHGATKSASRFVLLALLVWGFAGGTEHAGAFGRFGGDHRFGGGDRAFGEHVGGFGNGRGSVFHHHDDFGRQRGHTQRADGWQDSMNRRTLSDTATSRNRQSSITDRQENRQNTAQDMQQNRLDTARGMQQNRWNNINNTMDNRWDNYRRSRWQTFGMRAAGSALALGVRAATLPRGHVAVRGVPGYYYAGGSFYRPASGSGYVTVVAPVGAIVPAMPSGYSTVYAADAPYYYSGGTFYSTTPVNTNGNGQQSGGSDDQPSEGYKVVAPPIGASVPAVPKDAKEEKVKGTTYYVYGDTYYQPFHSGSDVVYMVVKDPHD